MKPLYLDINLGLGDALVCNGLVRFLARRKPGQFSRQIIVPCWEHNLPTVRHMLSDVPNVSVRQTLHGDGIPPDAECMDVLSIGINYRGPIDPPEWDKAFYDRARVPFDAKWGWFRVPQSATELKPGPGPYALVHDDVERGFEIDMSRALVPALRREPVQSHIRPILTDWRNLIRDAAEIHCIDSSVLHLAELMPTTGKLFYHKYARAKGNKDHRDPVLRKPWTVLG